MRMFHSVPGVPRAKVERFVRWIHKFVLRLNTVGEDRLLLRYFRNHPAVYLL